MRSFQLARRVTVGLLILGISVVAVALHAQQPTATTQNAQRILIHMKEYVGAVHEAYMALELADRLQQGGANVTLWLELQAVRLADDRVAKEGMDPKPGGRAFSEIYKSFIGRGGRVLVCHHCAQIKAIEKEHLRAGATLAGVDDVAKAILDTDKILDY